MRNIYFVGGVFEPDLFDCYIESSKGVIQNAANNYQCNIIKGLDKLSENGVSVISLPFLGSYPFFYSDFLIRPRVSCFYNNSKIFRLGFLNLPFVKLFSKFISLLKFIIKKNFEPDSTVFIYSMHLPFVLAVVLGKFLFRKKYDICLFVPDLPEYMNDRKDIAYRFLKSIEIFFINICIRHINKYVVLTEEMAVKMKLDKNQYIVIEGVADSIKLQENVGFSGKRIVFYSGTLASRYGVQDLVDAFSAINNKNYELWICGDGDSRKYIEVASVNDDRIKYLGQLKRQEVLHLQQTATVLVNPRRAGDEYTKYSFPSKIMEYMSSGRPVIMHKLPGIPSEYYQYCYTPTSSTFSSFVDCLRNTLALPSSELTSKGLAAKNFIKNNKNHVKQAEKIKDFLLRNN